MKQKLYNIIVGLCTLALYCGCTSDSLELDGDGKNVCRLVMDVAMSGFGDNGTRASSAWNDGDCILLSFGQGDGRIAGKAIYSEASHEWTLYYEGALPINTTACTACYITGNNGNSALEMDGEMTIAPTSCVYADDQGVYRKEAGVVYMRANLKPLTGRIRFYGEPHTKFYIIGVNYCNTYYKVTNSVETMTDNISTEIGADGFTPYLYIGLADADRTFTVFYDNARFVRQCPADVLNVGQSGYMQLPTKELHLDWTMTNEAPHINTAMTELTLEYTENSTTIVVDANIPWSVQSSTPWLSCKKLNGSMVSVTVTENNITEPERTATITLQDDTIKTIVTVKQRYCKINGHEFVDLGLPTGLLWATCNVGASKPEEYGDYFAWGETTPKNNYAKTWHLTYGKTMDALRSAGIIDENDNMTPAYDAACANWGDAWRMPTSKELSELREYTTTTWTTQNGVDGYKMISCINGNYIFLPAAGYRSGESLRNAGSEGYYWSLTASSGAYHARHYSFGTGEAYYGTHDRFIGQSVRPVCDNPMPFIRTAKTTVNFGQCANSRTVQINSNTEWEAECSALWVSLTKESESELNISVPENTTDETRTAIVSLKRHNTGEEKLQITISQYAETINGQGYVDLGLPSGLFWATCNVGASKPEGYGEYYAWGETATKRDYRLETYALNGMMTEQQLRWAGIINDLYQLRSAYDAASVNWGDIWRMPTYKDIEELMDNCDAIYTSQNGINGCMMTSKNNGNSIFLPAAGKFLHTNISEEGGGYYWSSTYSANWSNYDAFSCFSLNFSSGNILKIDNKSVSPCGFSIRPVSEP